jgi:hypothetical protein
MLTSPARRTNSTDSRNRGGETTDARSALLPVSESRRLTFETVTGRFYAAYSRAALSEEAALQSASALLQRKSHWH